jgi:hypothetical protein
VSDTSDPSEEPTVGAPDPDVPDLLQGDDTTAAAPAAEPDGSSGMSKDSQRLMIAVAILVVVAIAAIAVGIARKGSSDTASTTNSTATTATTAAGSKSSTTKAGDTNTTKAAGGCQNGAWPKTYTGKPDAAALKAAGIHVWNDNPGWKIRVVDPNAPGYKIEVVGSLAFDPKAVKAVGGATVDVKDNKTTIELPGGTEAAGIDFGLPCAVDQFTVAFVSKEAIVSPDLITVGKDAHAVGNPLIITKVKA